VHRSIHASINASRQPAATASTLLPINNFIRRAMESDDPDDSSSSSDSSDTSGNSSSDLPSEPTEIYSSDSDTTKRRKRRAKRKKYGKRIHRMKPSENTDHLQPITPLQQRVLNIYGNNRCRKHNYSKSLSLMTPILIKDMSVKIQFGPERVHLPVSNVTSLLTVRLLSNSFERGSPRQIILGRLGEGYFTQIQRFR
jgi:hypothetical protein